MKFSLNAFKFIFYIGDYYIQEWKSQYCLLSQSSMICVLLIGAYSCVPKPFPLLVYLLNQHD